jgi:hypothetical protein
MNHPKNQKAAREAMPFARLVRQGPAERRGSRRDRRLLEASLKYAGRFSEVEVHELSERGAWVVAEDEVPVLSDAVTLVVDLPEAGASVMVVGRVRRVGLTSRVLGRRGGFGIEFTRFFTEGGKHTLSRYLAA